MGTITKRPAGKQDVQVWDGGASDTFTADTSTSRTMTLSDFDWMGVDVEALYGARTQGAIDQALASIGTTRKARMWLAPGTWTLTANTTITSNITLTLPPGAVIDVGAYTLTVQGPFEAGHYEVFDWTTGVIDIETAPPHVSWWGALPDGATDSTSAIQAAVNCCARNKTYEVHFGAGDSEYLISDPIYFHYDAADNPNFPTGTGVTGRMKLVGKGMMDVVAHDGAKEYGTWIRSTSAAGTVIDVDGAAAGVYQSFNFRIEEMTLEGNTSAYIVALRQSPVYSGLSRCFIVQHGTGGGIYHTSDWLCTHNDLYIYKTDTGNKGTGTGFYASHPAGTVGGGLYILENVTVRNFLQGFLFGDAAMGAGASNGPSAIQCYGCQSNTCTTGVTVGSGIRGVLWKGSWIEHGTTAFIVAYAAENVNITNSLFTSSDVMIQVGTGAADTTNAAYCTVIENCNFTADNATTAFIKVYAYTTVRYTEIKQCFFDSTDSGGMRGIEITDGFHRGLSIDMPYFYGGNFDQQISDDGDVDMSARVQFTRGHRPGTSLTEQWWSTGKTGAGEGALTEPQFKFSQPAPDGAQAPLALYQRDTDKEIIELNCHANPAAGSSVTLSTTPGTGAVVGPKEKNAGVADGWLFDKMIKVRITSNVGANDEELWIPVFSFDAK